jgi:hypothetical protein
MKKPFLFTLAICLLVLDSFSQGGDWLSLSVGGSFPAGEFGSKNGNDLRSGLADVGGLVDLFLMHPLGKGGFGLAADLRGRMNPIDQSAVGASLASGDQGYVWSGKKAYWRTAALMVGGYYHFPVAKRWQVIGSFLLGVADSRWPKYTITGIKNGNDPNPANVKVIVSSTNGVNAVSFSALLKGGVTYQLSGRWCLLSNIGFWDLRPTFKNVTVNKVEANGFVIPGIYSLNNATSLSEYTSTFYYTQPMNTVDLSVGIGMRL